MAVFNVQMAPGTPEKYFLRYEIQEREQDDVKQFRVCLVGDRGEKPLHDWTADQTEAQRLFNEAVAPLKGTP